MKKHKDALSKTTLNRVLHNKYQPKGLVPTIKDPVDKKGRPLYEKKQSGWRRIKYKEAS